MFPVFYMCAITSPPMNDLKPNLLGLECPWGSLLLQGAPSFGFDSSGAPGSTVGCEDGRASGHRYNQVAKAGPAASCSTGSPQGPIPFHGMSSPSPVILDGEVILFGDTGDVPFDTLIYQPLRWLVELENNVDESIPDEQLCS
ncbi:unnamed protein product [Arctogadus glacialis]